MSENHKSIIEKFKTALEKDRQKFVKDWMVTWEYQERRKIAKKEYEGDLISEFSGFKGKEDLIKWMNWFVGVNFPDYINNQEIKNLIQKSWDRDKVILDKLELKFEEGEYRKTIGINNAHDFYIPTMLPSPYKIEKVIDFGAGFGRQANLWTALGRTYIAIDAIPNSYCLQNLYFTNLGEPFWEYMDEPSQSKPDINKKGIFHLPTWRFDLIPDGSIDLITSIQVIGELNTTLVKWLIGEFHRVLKPGGMLYLRDPGNSAKMATSLDYDKFIMEHDFSLEYKPHLVDYVDIHSIPRIYRRNDPRVIATQKKDVKRKAYEIISDVDYLTGGRLRKTIKAIKGK